MLNDITELHGIHHNMPQLLVNIVKANFTVCKWGRATGKTEGGLSDYLLDCAISMPGSVGAVGTDSFRHLRSEIWPGIEGKWQKRGLRRNIDYWIDKFPPPELNVPLQIRPIAEPKNVVFLRNGSAIKFFSFNFQALQNGDSIDFLGVEEVKLVKEKRLLETFLCVRGNAEYFGHLSCHLSKFLVSDLPDTPEGQYFHNWDELHDDNLVNLIINFQYHIQKLEEELDASKNKRRSAEIKAQLAILHKKINHYRKKCVYISNASTIQNLHALGYDTLKGYFQTTDIAKIKTSVLNIKPKQIGKLFYADLDEEVHGYIALSDKIDYIKYANTCLIDTDLNHREPLFVGLDYNSAITCMAVGQLIGDEFNMVNSMYVEIPNKIKHLATKFCQYYKDYNNKEVVYFYDNTAIGTDALRGVDETYKAEFVRVLHDYGWLVHEYRLNQTTHQYRNDEWAKLLKREDKNYPTFRYNKENCRDWRIACMKTPIRNIHLRDGRVKLEKNKLSEKMKSTIPSIEQTHITEAGDTLMIGVMEYRKNKYASVSFSIQ